MGTTYKYPVEAIKRDLLEETGYTCEEFIDLGMISANPANHNNLTHCFLALNVELVKEPHLDDTEQIKVIFKPLDEFIEYIKKMNLYKRYMFQQYFKL